MSVADDVREAIEKMPKAFQPAKAVNLEAVIQLELTGDGGGNWEIRIANGTVALSDSRAESADLTLSMAASDYLALTRGEVNPMNLFMAGKIKLQGDMSLALKFQDLFAPNQA
jgi:putative sterol carrier protein